MKKQFFLSSYSPRNAVQVEDGRANANVFLPGLIYQRCTLVSCSEWCRGRDSAGVAPTVDKDATGSANHGGRGH